jgi:extradiol dioxygenase family protein
MPEPEGLKFHMFNHHSGPRALHFSIPVTDLARAERLYRDCFRMQEEATPKGYIGFLINLSPSGGGRLSLRLVSRDSQSLNREPEPRIRSRHVGLAFSRLSDLEDALSEALSAGLVKLVEDDRSDDDELSKFVVDAEGNVIELYAPRDQSRTTGPTPSDIVQMLGRWNRARDRSSTAEPQPDLTSFMTDDVTLRHFPRGAVIRGREEIRRYDREFLAEYPTAYKSNIVGNECDTGVAVGFDLHRADSLPTWRVWEILERDASGAMFSMVSRIIDS